MYFSVKIQYPAMFQYIAFFETPSLGLHQVVVHRERPTIAEATSLFGRSFIAIESSKSLIVP